jgi:hypothetical protein
VSPPLERLAARASYDALAADIQSVEPTITRNVVALRVGVRARVSPYNVWDALTGSEALAGVRHIVAVRTSADSAIAPIDAESQIDGIVGEQHSDGAFMLGIDRVRRWALVRVPTAKGPALQQRPISALPTPIYVVVVEATQVGATLRPVFLGQGTRFNSVKWGRPLLPLGGIAISPGALLFTLDGEFIGAAVVDGGAPAIVEARDLFDTAARLTESNHGAVADLGLSVQRLTPELAVATGVQRGVVVAEVDSEGPASPVLEPGDVVTMVGDRSVGDPDGFLLDVAQRRVGETLEISFVRGGKATTGMLTARAAISDTAAGAMSFVRVPGIGTRVERGGRESATGLQQGDVVTRGADTAAPTPRQLRALLARPSTSGFLTLVVRRGGRQRVIAVPVVNRSHAASR